MVNSLKRTYSDIRSINNVYVIINMRRKKVGDNLNMSITNISAVTVLLVPYVRAVNCFIRMLQALLNLPCASL